MCFFIADPKTMGQGITITSRRVSQNKTGLCFHRVLFCILKLCVYVDARTHVRRWKRSALDVFLSYCPLEALWAVSWICSSPIGLGQWTVKILGAVCFCPPQGRGYRWLLPCPAFMWVPGIFKTLLCQAFVTVKEIWLTQRPSLHLKILISKISVDVLFILIKKIWCWSVICAYYVNLSNKEQRNYPFNLLQYSFLPSADNWINLKPLHSRRWIDHQAIDLVWSIILLKRFILF